MNQVTSFHPPALLQNLVDSKLKQAMAAQVRLQMYAPADLPTVKGNAQLLLKCLAALVDNAIKASQPGSRVVVRCHATHDRALMQATMAPSAAVTAAAPSTSVTSPQADAVAATAAAAGTAKPPPVVVTPPAASVTPPAFDSSSLPPVASSGLPPVPPAATAGRTGATAERLLPSPVDVTSPNASLSAVARSNLLSRACASPHPVYRGLQGAKRAALAVASARAAQAAAASADQLPSAMASMSLSASPIAATAAAGASTPSLTPMDGVASEASSSPVTVVRSVETAKAGGSLRSSDSPGKLRRSPRLQPYDDEDDDESSSSPLQPRSGRLAKAGSRDRSRSNSRVIAASTAAAVAAAAPAPEGLVLELVFQVLDEGVGFGGVELERLVAPQARLRGAREGEARTLSESESDHESVPTAPDGMDVSTTRSTNGGLGLGIPIARLSVRGMSGSFEIRSTPRGKHATAPGLAQGGSSSASSGGSVVPCLCSSSPGGDLCAACLQPGRWSSVCELMAPFVWVPPHLLLDAPQQQRILRHLLAPSLASTRANFPVLVVEDNAINSKILVNLLKKRGFTNVVTAADGRLALEAVEARRTRVALANAQRMLQRQVDKLTATLHDANKKEETNAHAVRAGVASATTATKALEESPLESEHFSLILLDCEMPVMDGFECTTVLRGMGCTTPIVALTANATFACQRRCYECGMDVFLNKPLASDSLFFTIAALPPFHAYPLALSPFFLHQ